jgi:hypothetical protein
VGGEGWQVTGAIGVAGGCLIGEASMSKSLYYMIKLLIGSRGMRDVSDGSRIRQGLSSTYSLPNLNSYPLAYRGISPLWSH